MVGKEYWRRQGKSGSHGYGTYINRGKIFYEFLFTECINNLGDNREIEILEVGCNVGGNLNFLKESGYKNLHGVDIGEKAIQYGKEIHPELNLHCQDALEFLEQQPDNYYDFVFTVGCLINISNPRIYKELYRVSKDIIMHKERDSRLPSNYKKLMDNCELIYEEEQPQNPGAFLRIYRKSK